MFRCKARLTLPGTSILLFLSACAIAPDPVPSAPGRGAPAVLFDIDGTLTPDIHAIGTARDGAAAAVARFSEAGVPVVYLTGRVRALQFPLRDWLAENGFPAGSLQVRTAAGPSEMTDYKVQVIREFQGQGWRFLAAFGDTSEDFDAYARAGIAAGQVFALQRDGEDRCEPGDWRSCHGDWSELSPVIDALLDAGAAAEELR